jgi:hypothetical protein
MFQIHPPIYPLGREAFVTALSTGHGRALVHAEEFGVADFRAEILGAAIEPMSYDTQVDGFREEWLASLCEAAGLVEQIIARREADDHVWQRCALLHQFSLKGYGEALPSLYEMWGRHRKGRDLPGVEDLIILDRERGLRFVACQLGELLSTEEGFWVDGSELEIFDEVHGEGSAERFLRMEAAGEPRIADYLTGVATTRTRWEGIEKSPFPQPVAEVVNDILTATRRYPRFHGWGRKASEDDRRQVVELFESLDDPVVLAKCLSCFAGTGFPSFDLKYLSYLYHPAPDVRTEAVRSLSHHREEPVRDAGLDALRRGDWLDGLDLLKCSALAGDAGEIFRALEMPPGEGEDFHSFVGAAVRILEENPAVGQVHLGLWIYERSPCMHCRRSAVEVMVGQGNCPSWVIEECLHDGSEVLRKLAAGQQA